MRTLRSCLAGVAVAAAGAAVITLQWWSLLVVVPAVLFAVAVDPDPEGVSAGHLDGASVRYGSDAHAFVVGDESGEVAAELLRRGQVDRVENTKLRG